MTFRAASVQTRGGVRLRITGARNAAGKVTQFRTTTKQKIEDVLSEEAPGVEERIRDQMYSWFSSGEGSGRAAASLQAEVTQSGNTTSLRIYIKDYREVKYFTTLVGGSDFRATQYYIHAHKQFLQFFWRALGRQVNVKKVLHPGFGSDIVREAAEVELARLGQIVQMRVKNAVAEVLASGEVTRV